MNDEPTFGELGPPVGDTTGVNRTPPAGGHTPGVKETGLARRFPLILAVIVGLGLITLGAWWWLNRAQPIPSVQLSDEAIPLDLQGLDELQTINGDCVASFIVHGIGSDPASQQRYALSIQLVGDPVDEAALAELMATDECAGELKLVGETLTERLGLKAAQQELITTSYVAKNGTRLVLP